MPTPTIQRSTNPLDHLAVDGVYIDERKPPGLITGIANDQVCIVAHFERGPTNVITSISSERELRDTFGTIGPDAAGAFYPGILALRAKKFGRLKVVRVSSATMATAGTNLATAGPTTVRADAKSPGAWGNRLAIFVLPSTDSVSSHFNIDVEFDGVIVERFRNLDNAAIGVGDTLPITSNFVRLTKVSAGRPDDVSSQDFTTGVDGTPAAGDYIAAIATLYTPEATNIRWVFAACEGMSSGLITSVNGALRDMAVGTGTKLVLLTGPFTQTKSQAITDVSSYRSDRVIYPYPAVDIFVPEAAGGIGALVRVGVNSFAAAVCSALPPGTDPASVDSEEFLVGIRATADKTLAHADYIALKEAGIMSLVVGERGLYRFRTGCTASLDSALTQIARRTMADFLQESIARALVDYQNKPLNAINKLLIKSAAEGFLRRQQALGLLPTEEDLVFGETSLEPFTVDIISGNSPQSEALGQFVVILKVRIFPSMRFIVLRTEIGENVEIKVSEVA